MILVLTYHRVVLEPPEHPEFYSVTSQRLDQHLKLLSQNGFRPIDPGDLLNDNGNSGAQASLGAAPNAFGAALRYWLTFDDGTVDHYEAVLPLLSKHGCRATFFIPTAKLDRPGYLSSAQAAELSRAGHTLGLHSHEHRRLDTMMEEDIRQQMQLSRNVLGELAGAPPVVFAPPGGYIDRRVRQIAVESGVRLIRTMRWGYNRKPDPLAIQCVPLSRAFSDKHFSQALKFKRQRVVVYALKELAKKFLPTRTYENLRGSVVGNK